MSETFFDMVLAVIIALVLVLAILHGLDALIY
jgi:hypothetical protein